MPGPHPSVALTRRAVRRALELTRPTAVVVGVSGGADSMALAAAVAFEAPKRGVPVTVVIVDHQLQRGSGVVAQQARSACVEVLGYQAEAVQVVTVEVDAASPLGLEAAAREARYEALRETAAQQGGALIFLGHTGDDQAEQVLLGMLRGSGTRSLAGIRVVRDDIVRPFLLGYDELRAGPVSRADTLAACEALGVTPWHDPHNDNPQFTRVKVRHLLAELESGLAAPTLRRSLIRTAASASRDADYLDDVATQALEQLGGVGRTELDANAVEGLAPAVRIRVLQRWLVAHGALNDELASHHLLDVESLVTRWHGQGAITVPGHISVKRTGGKLAIVRGISDNE